MALLPPATTPLPRPHRLGVLPLVPVPQFPSAVRRGQLGERWQSCREGLWGKKVAAAPRQGAAPALPPLGGLSLLPAWLPQGYIPPGHGPRPSSDASGPMALVLEPCALSQPHPGLGAGLAPPAQPCCHARSPVLACPRPLPLPEGTAPQGLSMSPRPRLLSALEPSWDLLTPPPPAPAPGVQLHSRSTHPPPSTLHLRPGARHRVTRCTHPGTPSTPWTRVTLLRVAQYPPPRTTPSPAGPAGLPCPGTRCPRAERAELRWPGRAGPGRATKPSGAGKRRTQPSRAEPSRPPRGGHLPMRAGRRGGPDRAEPSRTEPSQAGPD